MLKHVKFNQNQAMFKWKKYRTNHEHTTYILFVKATQAKWNSRQNEQMWRWNEFIWFNIEIVRMVEMLWYLEIIPYFHISRKKVFENLNALPINRVQGMFAHGKWALSIEKYENKLRKKCEFQLGTVTGIRFGSFLHRLLSR